MEQSPKWNLWIGAISPLFSFFLKKEKKNEMEDQLYTPADYINSLAQLVTLAKHDGGNVHLWAHSMDMCVMWLCRIFIGSPSLVA